MKNKRIIAFLFILVGSCYLLIGQEQFVNKNGYNEITSSDITFQWKIKESSLEIILKAPTKGWIAVGFDPSSMMQDANFIIGYVRDGQVFVRDDYGTWFSSHASDESLGGNNDITGFSGNESSKKTQISFTIPLDSGDEYDRLLMPGQQYQILLSYGEKDDFKSIHRKKTVVTITL